MRSIILFLQILLFFWALWGIDATGKGLGTTCRPNRWKTAFVYQLDD